MKCLIELELSVVLRRAPARTHTSGERDSSVVMLNVCNHKYVPLSLRHSKKHVELGSQINNIYACLDITKLIPCQQPRTLQRLPFRGDVDKNVLTDSRSKSCEKLHYLKRLSIYTLPSGGYHTQIVIAITCMLLISTALCGKLC